MHLAVAKDRERERDTRPGNWVAAARREAGARSGAGRAVSQMRLAVLAGRDRNTVARWEMADGEVDYITWVGLLALLDLPLDWEPAAQPIPSRAKRR